MKFYNWHGFLVLGELDLPKGGAVQVQYLKEGRWEPASVLPNLTEESLFAAHNSQDWDWATEYCGLVPERMVRDNRVYWNFTVNFGGIPKGGTARLKITRAASGGRPISIEEVDVQPDYGSTVVLKNWADWSDSPLNTYEGMEPCRQEDPADAPHGWCVANCTFGPPRLTLFGQEEVKPLRYCPGLSGKYDLYVCIKEHALECDIELPGCKVPQTIMIGPRMIPFNKFWKEIYVAQADFTPEDTISIHQCAGSRVNKLHRFGDIFYLKLVPADRPAVPALPFTQRPREIIFYSEPYSLAYTHLLIKPEDAERIADRYLDLGVDKIVCQMGRIGAFVLYPNTVGGRGREGAVSGDDRQSSVGPALMMANMDIMKVFPDACHRRGIKFLANMGVNTPYRGTTLESKFAVEHPQFYHHHSLDFNIPEVVDFAAEHFREMARYDIDGLSVSHTRYPEYMSVQNIVDFHRKIVEKIGLKRRAELEINISFVAGYPEYYQAVEILLQENLVDSIVPSNLMSIVPPIDLEPFYQLTQKYGKTLYGMLDGWSLNYGGFGSGLLVRPNEYAELAERYLAQGATGLYFYQSESILRNVFNRRLVKALKLPPEP
ncbi:MAG: hypothetical protein IKP00_09635 [Victivallales bacterium]|nr:hypothetical protein [Victivallales bacterium]